MAVWLISNSLRAKHRRQLFTVPSKKFGTSCPVAVKCGANRMAWHRSWRSVRASVLQYHWVHASNSDPWATSRWLPSVLRCHHGRATVKQLSSPVSGSPPSPETVDSEASSSASVHGLEDRHDLLSRMNGPRVGKGPVVEHAVGGDPLQIVLLDADVAQPPRQAQPGDKSVEHLGSRMAGRTERGADLGLAIGIDRRVERQHGRQHDAGRVAMGYPGTAAQHMSDGVARPHTGPAHDAGHRDPGADLAVESRRE